MTSSQEPFDCEKVRNDIFQTRNKDIRATIEFVALTARFLKEKGKENEFHAIIDKSLELLRDNVFQKKSLLLRIAIFAYERPNDASMLKYYQEVEKLLDGSLINERSFKMKILFKIGEIYLDTADFRKAIEFTSRAKGVSLEIEDKSAEALCFTNLGHAHFGLAEYPNAIDCFLKGLELSRELGDISDVALNSTNLGGAYYNLGDSKKAIEYYLQSLEISTALGDRSGIARNNGNLGSAYRNLGEYRKAIHYYEKGLQISTAMGDRSVIANISGNLGNAYLNLGQYRKALDYYFKGLEISTAVEDWSGIANIKGNIGNAYRNLGEYPKAIDYYQHALEISTRIGDRSGIAANNGNLGKVYRNLADYEKAIKYFQEGLEMGTAIGDQLLIASINGGLGNVCLSLGECEKAIDHFQKALEISTTSGHTAGIARSNGNLGNVYLALGDYIKAIDHYQKGLEISTAIGDQEGIASETGNLGNAYLSLGDFEKSIDYFQQSLAMTTEIGKPLGMASNNAGLGDAYHKLGEYQKAIVYFQKALEISSSVGDRSAIASHNGNLGNIYCDFGEYERAIDYYREGLQISTAIGDRSGMAVVIGNLASAYLSLGEYGKAIIYHQKSLEISTSIGDRSGVASQNCDLGNAYFRLGDYQNAIDHYQTGLEIGTEIGDRSEISRNNGNLGNVYFDLGEYKKAADYHQKSLEISTSICDQPGIASSNCNLGNVYRTLGQYETAVELYKKGLDISVNIGNPGLEALCLAGISYTYFFQGMHSDNEIQETVLEQSAFYLKRSIDCSDRIFSRLAVDKNKISFSKEYFKRFVILMHCFIFMKRIEAALLVFDLGKAKALHGFLEKQKQSETGEMAGDMSTTWTSIDRKEEHIQVQEIRKVLKLKTNNASVLLFAFDLEGFLNIWIVNGEDDTHALKLDEHSDTFFDLLTSLLESVEVNLNRDFSFHKLESNARTDPHVSMPFQFTRKSEEKNDDNGIPKLERMNLTEVRKFQQSNSRWSRGSANVGDFSDQGIFEKLFRLLILPLQHLIAGTHLIIVPDKSLFFAPFYSFLDECGSWLSERYSVQITPSIHTLVSSMRRRPDIDLGFAFFVGNPTVGKVIFRGNEFVPPSLSNANEEVKHLAKIFDAKPLLEGEATKKNVLTLLSGAGLIHIAAHGEPEHGEIFLSPNVAERNQNSSLPKETSYLLRQRDILNIAIDARLVILCCCNTGRGKISSEGVVGLTRAFLAAGARSVLATLWPIRDEATKEFIQNFYDEILEGTSVCQALRRTMNNFQNHENEEFRSAKIWAPFTIYGEDVMFSQNDIAKIKQKSREMFF